MKRLINVALAVVLLVGLYGQYSIGYTQDENENKPEQTENSGEKDETDGSDKPVPEVPPSEDQPGNSEEQPPAEDKTYSCSKCGYSSDGPGDCPACNVSLTEGAPASEETEGDYTSETGGDSSAPTGDESSSGDSEVTTPSTESED